MNQIKVQIVGDSVNAQGDRITSLLLTYPRIIHAELLTHRAFTRNAASSRAVPFKRMVRSIQENPFIPIAWQKDHSGMQGAEYITNEDNLNVCIEDWLRARDCAIEMATNLSSGFPSYKSSIEGEDIPREDKVTKQLCNRLLEPFQYYTSLVTATDFENFFELRCPVYVMEVYDDNDELVPEATEVFRSRKDIINNYPNWYIRKDENKRFGKFPSEMTGMDWLYFNKGAAEIHLMNLAEKIWDAMNESVPEYLEEGEFHIPFKDKIYNRGIEGLSTTDIIKISTAMAARTSYTVVGDEKEVSYETLIGIHDRIVNARPLHASPLEHCARANKGERSRNFKGFTQYREILENSI